MCLHWVEALLEGRSYPQLVEAHWKFLVFLTVKVWCSQKFLSWRSVAWLNLARIYWRSIYMSANILNFVFRSLSKIIKILIIVITSQTFECFWISVTQIRSNHVNRNWYSAGQEIISIEDYLLLPFNSTELLEPHCKQATSKQTAWISHFWAK